MSGPTGFEAGGARTLLKTIEYTIEDVPPADYPAPSNVFSGFRNEHSIPTDGGDPAPVGYTATNPATGTDYTVLTPTWGGPAIIIGSPPGGGSLSI